MTKSVTMIVPAAHRDALNAMALEIDPEYGPETFSIPLSATGARPATHWAASAWETPGTRFERLRLAVQAGGIPPGLEAYDAALRSIVFRVTDDPEQARSNFLAALIGAGLKELEPVV